MEPTNRPSRVFVSSTFSDFKHERDALQVRVFSALRAYCESGGSRKLEECQRIATLLQAIGNDVILLSSESLAGDDTGASSGVSLAGAYASVAKAMADRIVEHINRERSSSWPG